MIPTIDIASLTPAERLDLIGRLWDSLNAKETSAADQTANLDIRLAEARRVEEFNVLAERWRRETGVKSDSEEIAMHPDYQKIIGMGNGAIPLILNEMATRGGHWFWALRAITRESHERPEHAGNIKAITEDWLKWGRERGYI
jgi:putative addiction module component (TIGR02574 family)